MRCPTAPAANTMGAKRCPACETEWPPSIDFEVCPECGIRTCGSTGSPIRRDVAEQRANQAEFRRRYADHELERIKRGDPSPEDVGAGEAHQILREIAKLEEAFSRDLAA